MIAARDSQGKHSKMNKLKAVARSVSFSTKPASSKNNRSEKEKLEPVVGFSVTLCDAAAENTSGKI